MPVKPALPEKVQQYRVMAEDAYKNKDFEKALDYYRKGLAIEPLWPQGQYDAAIFAGELHQYNWATLYMKRYMELVPDALNAKVAREKMYLWEGKAAEESEGYLGITAHEIADDAGVIVTDVENGSQADKIGIKPQDIIVQVNKVKIVSIKEYNKEMRTAVDKKIAVLLIKRGNTNFFVDWKW